MINERKKINEKFLLQAFFIFILIRGVFIMGLIESSNIDKISRGSRNHAEFFERNAMVAQNFTITMKSRCPSQKSAEKRQVECNMLIRNRAMTQDHNQQWWVSITWGKRSIAIQKSCNKLVRRCFVEWRWVVYRLISLDRILQARWAGKRQERLERGEKKKKKSM